MLTFAQLDILEAIEANPQRLTLRQIGAAANMTGASVHRWLNIMKALGWVANEEGVTKSWRVTDAGRDIIRSARPLATKVREAERHAV